MNNRKLTENYKEGPVISVKALVLLLAAMVALFVGGFYISVYIMLTGLIGFFVATTTYSIGRYNGIVLTDTVLRVGKDKVLISELDPSYGAKDGEEMLTVGGQYKLEWGITTSRRGLKIMGGSWGRPAVGYQWVVVQPKDSPDLLVIASLHKDTLMTKLNYLMNTPSD